MSDKEDTSLILRPSGKLAHIPPGASAIIDSMVNDATDLISTRDADRQEKTGSQSNTRWDPEVMTLGTELAAFYIEAGARNFGLYVKNVRSSSNPTSNPGTMRRAIIPAWSNIGRR